MKGSGEGRGVVADYLTYVRDPASGYINVSFPVDDGMEISCRAGTSAAR